jgi:hypothetical protein
MARWERLELRNYLRSNLLRRSANPEKLPMPIVLPNPIGSRRIQLLKRF